MRDLTFTVYKNARSTAGEPHTRPWNDWIGAFSKRDVREQKDGPAVILGEIAKGKRRSSANVRAAHAIGIDIEKMDEARIEAVFDALEPFTYFVWTTHSHTPSKPRLRVIVPFAEPIEPSDYQAAWSGLNALIGSANDPQTKDISRLHYLPSCPPGAEQHAHGWGHLAENNRLISFNTDIPETTVRQPEEAPPAADPLAVRRLVAKVRSRLRVVHKDDPIKPLARALHEDEALASSGGRHEAIRELTWWMAEKDRDLPVAAIAELFSGSLTAMRKESPNDSPSLEEVWDAYSGAVNKILEGEEKAADKVETARKKKAQAAQMARVGAKTKYDEEDLIRIAGMHDWEPYELKDRWIIQREGMHWMLDSNGQYRGPYNDKDAAVNASRMLARAPIRLMEIGRNGASYRPMTDIVRESGQVAERIVSDLIMQETKFDPETLTLHEAIRPLRPITPKFDEDIDQWLRLMAGAQYDRLVDWLSCVPDLSKMLCAVYLDGPKGAGKTLLPTGLARLWTQGPPGEIELVLSDFNDEIARCPLILADEEMPKPLRNADVTAKLRSMLSTVQRALKRKYKPPTDMIGAVRLMLAANNEFLLQSKGVATAQDLEAVAQRFLYINVTQESADHMDHLPRKQREYWMHHGIAAHTMWLYENHTVKEPGKRFWVEGDMSQMHRMLMTGSRWNSMVCEWLVRYLMQPNLYDNNNPGFIRRGDGQLMVNDQAVIDGWDLYMQNTKSEPETSKIGTALRSLSASTKRPQLRHGTQRIRYRIIDVDHLLAWSDRLNIGDRETIIAAVNGTEVEDYGNQEELIEDFQTLPAANTKDVPF